MPAAQPAADRRAAEAALRTLVGRHAPAHVRLVAAARKWLRERLPTAHEIVYEYRDCFVISVSPTPQGYEGVFALRGSVSAVQLYFNQGKGLPDPAKLLKGTGKLVRFLDLERPSPFANPDVLRLVDAALARNLLPYPRDGQGSLLIRQTVAGQRRGSDT